MRRLTIAKSPSDVSIPQPGDAVPLCGAYSCAVNSTETDMSARPAGIASVLTLVPHTSAKTRSWPDAQLIAAVQEEPPNQDAWDELVTRHWHALFARCRKLTRRSDLAWDLAQETWSRVLRARATLRPDGNFPAYLNIVARNICRDQLRSSRRAGDMAEHRLLSLELPIPSDEHDTLVLADIIPERRTVGRADRLALAIDIHGAFAQLTPRLRAVVAARYVRGESTAAISRRYNCSEQTINSWLRRAGRLLQEYLTAS